MGKGEGGIKDRAELCTVLKACGWNRSTSLEMENDSVYIYIYIIHEAIEAVLATSVEMMSNVWIGPVIPCLSILVLVVPFSWLVGRFGWFCLFIGLFVWYIF